MRRLPYGVVPTYSSLKLGLITIKYSVSIFGISLLTMENSVLCLGILRAYRHQNEIE